MNTTDNPSATVDTETFSVRRTITISAPIEKVWAAITQAEHLARWFPQQVTLGEVAVGSRGTFTFEGHGTVPVVIEEVDEPRMIAYRWGNESGEPASVGAEGADPDRSTVFRFFLEGAADGTRLTVIESGFDALSDPTARMNDNRGGWDSELDELVAYLEGAS
ncbi:SRPBCC family protein [Subtercola sp. YIM 133946]|uniref:SRPBCC family protein n=1 Tax=Subtercola sp. YIM 133946 TaxID=3118909 RepID=UPI002F934987